MNRFGVLVVWGFAAGVTLAVAAGTSVGPVVVSLEGLHGIHVGDLVALALASAWAWRTTRGALRAEARPRSGPDR